MKKIFLIAILLTGFVTLSMGKEAKVSEIQKALATLQKGKWIDLTHTVNESIPRFGSFPSLEKEALYKVKDDGFFVYKNSFVTQYGTHIDVPVHFVDGKRTLEQIELKELILPLVVINKEKEVKKNPDFILKKNDILAWEKVNGKIPQGSFVAFASGWSKKWGKEDFNNKDSKGVAHTPGWSIEALDFVLNERGATAIGHETFDTDASSDVIKNKFFESEKFVLDQDKYQIELLNNLTLLPEVGGIIIIGVPKFEGYPGFPVRAFAIVP
ncbi:MAG: cyclase family protein [Helicobacter sp.]|uniref:cyclase family protein n=1 Tax=Helicobacter sp. 10-6591 TaxID=2004998 RepID=UPI00215C6685|nr:cyclase family protein [Helicobacter sp. 10-6591]MCI7484691.1 cyclase family protein [Helicobacter sp.]MDD7567562.1 cyclase family protein [Helicobacter sp.]MDY5741158.1 cyclase family protein [Helicobacter sp.]